MRLSDLAQGEALRLDERSQFTDVRKLGRLP